MNAWPGVDVSGQVLSRMAAAVEWPWIPVNWSEHAPEQDLYLCWSGQALSLCDAKDPKSALCVDFVQGPQARRLSAVSGEGLTRALGCQKGVRPKIIDATAGLGGDASVLANLGCSVVAHEREPLIAALLADGLRRARDAGLPFSSQLQLVHGDATRCLGDVDAGVIYLDPMFEPSRKAQPKFAMQLLHRIAETTVGAEQLLLAALDSDAARVVVKRPLKAPPLAGVEPHAQIRGKVIRFDLYPRRKLLDRDNTGGDGGHD